MSLPQPTPQTSTPPVDRPSPNLSLVENIGDLVDASLTFEDHSTDSSMLLAIGSDFECRTRVTGVRMAEVKMDARVLFRRSVIQLMEGIQSISTKVDKTLRSRTTLWISVKSVSETEGRLWAVLDMSELTNEERQKVRSLATAVTSEIYRPTDRESVSAFRSRLLSAHPESMASDVQRENPNNAGNSSCTTERRELLDAAEESLPPHLQQVVLSCNENADAESVIAAVELMVKQGYVLGEELSKSKEMKNLDLRLGNETLFQRNELPKSRPANNNTEPLPAQDALLVAVNFDRFTLTLKLLVDEATVTVGYNDLKHGDALGEVLLNAHNASRGRTKVVSGGQHLARVRAGLTKITRGLKESYKLESLEALSMA